MRWSVVAAVTVLLSGCRPPPYYSLHVLTRTGVPCESVIVRFGPWREDFTGRKTTYYVVVRHDGSARAAPLTYDEVVAGAAQRMASDGGSAYRVGIKNNTADVLRNPTVWFGRYPVTPPYCGPPDSRVR